MSKKMQNLNTMDIAGLKLNAEELRKEVFFLRMKKFSSPEKNTALVRNLRKNLARTLTVLKHKEAHSEK